MASKAVDKAPSRQEFSRLLRTAAQIKDQSKAAIEMAFFLIAMGRLALRLGEVLHFNEDWVKRDKNGNITEIRIGPVDCDCSYCWELAGKKATRANKIKNNEKTDLDPNKEYTAEDFIDEYFSPKTDTGIRQIPVVRERQRQIIESYLNLIDSFDAPPNKNFPTRRITRLAEVTDGVNSEQLSPQGLRAAAAEFWISLKGFDMRHLKTLMGWKYLTTAKNYTRTLTEDLRRAMLLAIGKEVEPAFDPKAEPPAFEELQSQMSEENKFDIEQLTPEEEYEATDRDMEDGLEREAVDEEQLLLAEFGGKQSVQAVTPFNFTTQVTGWGVSKIMGMFGRWHTALTIDPRYEYYPVSRMQEQRFVGLIALEILLVMAAIGVLSITGSLEALLAGEMMEIFALVLGLLSGIWMVERSVPSIEEAQRVAANADTDEMLIDCFD